MRKYLFIFLVFMVALTVSAYFVSDDKVCEAEIIGKWIWESQMVSFQDNGRFSLSLNDTSNVRNFQGFAELSGIKLIDSNLVFVVTYLDSCNFCILVLNRATGDVGTITPKQFVWDGRVYQNRSMHPSYKNVGN